MRRYYRFKRYPFGQIADNQSTLSIVDIQWNDSAVLQHRCSPDNPELLDLALKPVNLLLSVIRSFSEQVEKEDEVYYYHGDHLGSASWITDKTGTPIQYIHYAPYGELIANQRASGYDERFKFTGKERDTESGYNYHGARFLWGDAGFWLSVDPLVDKYPNVTPYLYCNGNPIRYIDPDGRFPYDEIWDAVFILYDAFSLAYNKIVGDKAGVRQASIDLSADVSAICLPYVPAGLSRVGKISKIFKRPSVFLIGEKSYSSAEKYYEATRKLPLYERIASYRQTAKQIARKNNWNKDVKLSKKYNRDIYKDSEGIYYSLDTRHGEFEVLDKQGKHIDAMDFDGKFLNKHDASGNHNIDVN